MESGPSLLFLLCLLLPRYSQVRATPPWHRRFEYKFSFKGPRLAVVGQEIPFWNHHGDAIPGLEEVRLAPSMRNRSGAMWTQAAIPFPNWEVEVTFHISGLGRLGAEGMAVWYTRDRGQTGPALGGPAFWDGIGILFDSFDNDDQNNPVIQVLANDGQIPYDHLRDGGGQVLGSCLWDFRNQPYPFRARITYWEEKLQVSVDNGLTTQGAIDEVCTEVGPLLLPPRGFFGVSAATGTIAGKDLQLSLGDWQGEVAPMGPWLRGRGYDHDVLSFLTFSLSKPAPEVEYESGNTSLFSVGSVLSLHPAPTQFSPQALPYVIPEAEQLRLKRQLQDLQKELKHQKETSPRPDLATPSWEVQAARDSGHMISLTPTPRNPSLSSQLTPHPGEEYLDLQLTLKRHSQVLEQLQDLSGKMTQTVGQWRNQMQSLGRLDEEKDADGAQGRGWNSAAVRVLLQGQQTLLQNMQEMRAAAARIASKAKAFYLPVGTEYHFQELHQTLTLLQRDVESLQHLLKRAAKSSCSHAEPGRVLCLSRSIFLLFLLIQTGCAFYCLFFRWESDRSLKECFSKSSLVLVQGSKQLFRRVPRQDSLTQRTYP
ncbi:protein ERGIC-53-like [Notamacropus eugenii]|uniref:protein ERGIC-53-like n=1 Tax=Notamacropus eugenii TaxID=9315 RepID=UPI003B66BEF3